MFKLYDQLISDSKILICFHKSCVDGLFSVVILLENLESSNSYYEKYELVPLTPNEIIKKTAKIKALERKSKIILDLPYFGSNVLYYFDHHITNEKKIPKEDFKGLFDRTAASTCAVLEKFFRLENKKDYSMLIEIANTIDQASFATSPPAEGPLELRSINDIIWACNDLIKDVRDETILLKLIDSFDKSNLQNWIKQNKKFIMNYRKRRQETLNIKNKIDIAPIIIIKNETFNLQVEGLHFSLAAEEKDYLMLVLIDKVKNYQNKNKILFKVSFRLNPKLTDSETDILRVDKIASELGGGGHKGAASASVNDVDEAYIQVLDWIKTLQNDYSENFI